MLKKIGLSLLATTGFYGVAQAATIEVTQSNLIDSDYYYTDLIGGGLGSTMVTTGGGSSAANIGAADGRNDDGYMFLDPGFDISFFDTLYSSLYINNNGNVSFGEGISGYVPTGPTGALAPVISPFFSDVDTRHSASGLVHYRTDIDNQLVVTWDQVGYFNSHANRLNSIQLVLRGSDYDIPEGEGAVGFFYTDMGWEVTNTSRTAAVGFGNGKGDAIVLEGSNDPGMYTAVQNSHIWFNQNLTPVIDETPVVIIDPVDPTDPVYAGGHNDPAAGVTEPSTGLLAFAGIIIFAGFRKRLISGD